MIYLSLHNEHKPFDKWDADLDKMSTEWKRKMTEVISWYKVSASYESYESCECKVRMCYIQ